MSRTKMQSYNLLLVTIAILMGVAVTVVAIIWIWTESSFSELAGRLVGSFRRSATPRCWSRSMPA